MPNFGFRHSDTTKKKIGESRKGKKHSEETKNKIRIANRRPHPWMKKGKYASNWQGGKSKINARIRISKEYKLWRKAVFERDNYTCVWCKERSRVGKAVIIHADHIKPFAYFPELRFAIDNGRTLCIECHRKTDTWGKKLKI